VCLGVERLGKARSGWAVEVSSGEAGSGAAWRSRRRGARLGVAWRFRCGEAR
jgi:hypothetical protein